MFFTVNKSNGDIYEYELIAGSAIERSAWARSDGSVRALSGHSWPDVRVSEQDTPAWSSVPLFVDKVFVDSRGTSLGTVRGFGEEEFRRL